MIDEKKKPSWFIGLRPKKSSCCNVVIEDDLDEAEASPCCDNSTAAGDADKALGQEDGK